MICAELTQVYPASSFSAAYMALSMSWVHTEEPSPKMESLASAKPSSRFLTRTTGRAGPNTSSLSSLDLGSTSTTMDGFRKLPLSNSSPLGRSPPTSTLAPFCTASSTCSSTSSRCPLVCSGPSMVPLVRPLPTRSLRTFSTSLPTNSS